MTENDNREESLRKLREKRDAYLQVFGPVSQPTPLGEIILKDLKAFTKHGSEPLHMDNHGRMDESTTIYRLGKQVVYQRIIEMIEWSETYGIGSRTTLTARGRISSTVTDGGDAST